MSFREGGRALFTASDSEHTKHNGPVSIVRPLKVSEEVDEEVGPMYRVRSGEDQEFDVFEDELTPL